MFGNSLINVPLKWDLIVLLQWKSKVWCKLTVKKEFFFLQGHVVDKLEFFQKLPQVEVYYTAFHSENSFYLNADAIGDLNL